MRPPTMKKFLPLLLLCGAGCASSHPYYFTPSPAEIRIEPDGEALIARTLITVLAGEPGDPPQMLLRLRIENLSTAPVRLEPGSVELVGSDLAEFGLAQIEPADTEVLPTERRTFDLRFPFPQTLSLSAPNLDGLHLTWRLAYAGGTADVSTTFQRIWDQPVPYGEPNITWSLHYGFCR